jgi:hypothetical protein
MTTQAAVVPDAETRWRNWQARGVESDRRTAKTMRGVLLAIVAAWLVWFGVGLT